MEQTRLLRFARNDILEKNVRFLLDTGNAILRRSRIEDAALATELLLAHILRTTREKLYTRERPVSGSDAARFLRAVARRAAGIPLQYITGRVSFYGHDLAVQPGVLIPRPETELLVETVLETHRRGEVKGRIRMLDIGTGSGAIAIALAAGLEQGRVTATDISRRALTVARRNAVACGVAGRISFQPADLFPTGTTRFDYIVGNPPYIPTRVLASLPEEVRREPARALDGGPRGLDCITRILRTAPRYLRPGGYLFLEIGKGQSALLKKQEFAGLRRVEFRRDFAGIERVVLYRKAC